MHENNVKHSESYNSMSQENKVLVDAIIPFMNYKFVAGYLRG